MAPKFYHLRRPYIARLKDFAIFFYTIKAYSTKACQWLRNIISIRMSYIFWTEYVKSKISLWYNTRVFIILMLSKDLYWHWIFKNFVDIDKKIRWRILDLSLSIILFFVRTQFMSNSIVNQHEERLQPDWFGSSIFCASDAF